VNSTETPEIIAVAVALIGAGAAIVSSFIAHGNRRRLDTENGRTLGQTVYSLSKDVGGIGEHIDVVETKIDEHIEETKPLVERFVAQNPDLKKKRKANP